MTTTIITELSSADLCEWMQPTDSLTVIEFFASWCIYHQLTRRKLERLSAAMAEKGCVTRTGAIDALGNEEALQAVGITQIPSIGCYWDAKSLLWIGDTDLDVMLEDFDSAHEHNFDSENWLRLPN